LLIRSPSGPYQADRYNPALKVFHGRLAATNKKPKSHHRRRHAQLNAMLRDNVAWQPKSA
jgi:hypothetical protein